MPKLRHLLLLSLSLLSTAACVDSDDKGPEEGALAELEAAGKDDSFQRPTEHGALAYDAAADARLTSTARYHAWDFNVRLSGSTPVVIDVGPQTATGPGVDTVLYLYKKKANGTWGSYLVRNDDHDGLLWSRIARGLEGGDYRVIVKGYAERTYGKFAVKVTCDRYACSAPAATCAFGDTFNGLDRQRFTFGSEAALTSAVGLDALTRAQIVRAMQASSHTDVTTAEQAFLRADQGIINRREMVDVFAIRRYFSYEYGAGDNSYGAIFDERDVEPATEIHDGDFAECRVPLARCLFGNHYDLGGEPDLAIQLEKTFGSHTATTPVESAQIVAAARLHVTGINSASDIFARVTDAEVRKVDVVHTPTRRQYTFITYVLGDHRYGAAFAKDTSAAFAVEIHDDEFRRCDAF